MRAVFALVLVGIATTSATAQTRPSYGDACDASAGAAIGRGRFVVADDEGNVLRVYERTSAQPVDRLDLTDHLHNRKDRSCCKWTQTPRVPYARRSRRAEGRPPRQD
jgi:hypothetical protein